MIDFILLLRLVQFLFAIVCLGLIRSTYDYFVLAEYAGDIFLVIVVSSWTLVFVPYLALAPKFCKRFANKFAILTLDALTMLLWFPSCIVPAVELGGPINCSDSDDPGVCRRSRAAIVFGGFEWFLFTVTTVLAALHVYKTRGSSSIRSGAHADVQPGSGMATL